MMLFFLMFFCDVIVHVVLLVKVKIIVILSHFPPLHVHSIMSLVGADVLEYAHLLPTLPLLHVQ